MYRSVALGIEWWGHAEPERARSAGDPRAAHGASAQRLRVNPV
jgi:hypothetical protein